MRTRKVVFHKNLICWVVIISRKHYLWFSSFYPPKSPESDIPSFLFIFIDHFLRFMKHFFALAILLTILVPSCRKENSAGLKPEDRTQASIEIDGETVSVAYNGDQVNKCETYSFAGNAGYYYGVSSVFEMSEKQDLQIIFGTTRTSSSHLTEEAFLTLIRRGERAFGSLGAFSSYPRLDSDKVEIAFTDKKSVKWCSTAIAEFPSEHGVETSVSVNQPDGKFVIEEMEKVDGMNGYRVKGTFKCFVYEVNGKGKKTMNGKFVGIVRME